jgi:BMFP domain-containing protein YqiC
MGEEIFKVIDIKDHEFQKIHDRINFESSKTEESIKDILCRLEIISEELHNSFTSIIKDTREKIHDSFLAIMKDIENKHNTIIAEIASIRVMVEMNKSNIKCIENVISDMITDVDKIKLQIADKDTVQNYDIEQEITIEKLANRVQELENKLNNKPKGFFKRLFGK